ncbi:preprotein translocase subunit SecE [Mycolicibacterium palauense]|uniref:preprotein translocase subunit SecE n=1 Tax=Mycolicibacterium palauense TaxID=2034511 RepID=UPI00159BBB34|nr:preprotein translocase subunit SecE [Mycolicibacterium palauense]
MSDERDGADAAGAGTDDDDARDSGGRAVGTATPMRPTGKRTRQRALAGGVEDTEPATEVLEAGDGGKNGSGTTAKTKKDGAKGPSRNPFAFVFNYLRQVVAELRKVIWPNRKQMVTYTSVVLVFLAFMVALIGVTDLGLAKLVLLIFG